MAEAILFGIAGSLLKNLGSRALDEIASARGFKTHLEKLKNTVNTIKDVLLDAEERQEEGHVESHAVRGWLDRLKTPLYAADDLFDEFATVAFQWEAMGKVHTFFSGSNHIAFAFNISRNIKKIREELDDIVKDSSQFTFVLRPQEVGRLHNRVRGQTYSFVDVEEVIGREDDREAIIDILMASCAPQAPRLSVIPIVGIGGLGKTTLAQLVYNDERIDEHFDRKLWVCVSEVFDLKEVIKKILMSVTNSECKNVEIEQLQGQLRKEISGEKYLLVLDDVWNEIPEEWLNLSTMLKVGGDGSMILVTTRSGKVADIMGTFPAYVLGGLSEEKSWSLFEKMAFEPGESQKKPRLVNLGKEIMKKCANVPLALRTLGSLLRGYEEWKWISIAGITFAKLHDEQNNNEQNNMMAILKLSYHHLLSPLKNCFAYCALFPKDYKFEKKTLVDLWMAEGFVVPPYETQSFEELGYHYLILLLQRCFFQDVTTDEFGNISSFKMHDLMHDLALDVSGTQCKVAKFLDRNFTNRTWHLSFGHQLTNLWEIPNSMLTAKQLRTFLLPQQFRDGSDFKGAVLQQLISNFRCLRVLDLRNLGIRTLPKSIGKLLHLRYLNLSENPMEKLPNSIIKLQNLQTLILYNCRRLRALPMHTSKLRNLRSLDILDCWSLNHLPPGLGELTSLHKLPIFVVKSKTSPKFKLNPATAQLRDLKTLNNLSGYLEIRLCMDLEDPSYEAKEANLISKHGLTDLLIQMGDFSNHVEAIGDRSNHDEGLLEGLKPHQNLKKLEIKWYRGQKLPSWAMGDSLCMTLPNLVEICLSVFDECREVPCFSQLPFLKRLTVWNLRNVEYMEKGPLHVVESPPPPSTRTFFPSLEVLVLNYMGNLKGWWEETKVVDCSDEEKLLQPSTQCHPPSPSFSGLIKLHINDCPRLTSLPVSPNVEALTLQKVNKELTVLKKVTNSEGSSDVGSSKLKRLRIDDVEVLISMPVECLGHLTSLTIDDDTKFKNTSELEEVFKHLSSLTSLKFSCCPSLASISVGMEHLVSLESLVLYWCSELDISEKGEIEDGMPWKALTSLRELELLELNKLKQLPSGLQHLTNLRHLRLFSIPNIEEVPEWIGCLSSLEYMEFEMCDKLTCFPEEMRNLTSLNLLRIEMCSRLTKRCRGPNGADWPYIRHIPHLIVQELPF